MKKKKTKTKKKRREHDYRTAASSKKKQFHKPFTAGGAISWEYCFIAAYEKTKKRAKEKKEKKETIRNLHDQANRKDEVGRSLPATIGPPFQFFHPIFPAFQVSGVQSGLHM